MVHLLDVGFIRLNDTLSDSGESQCKGTFDFKGLILDVDTLKCAGFI